MTDPTPAPETARPSDPADVAVVGAGPIGIELHVALREAGLRTVHLEAGPIGSTFRWWAPRTQFFSSPERLAIAGVPLTSTDQSKPTGEAYLAYLRGVVRQFDLPIRTYTRVAEIERGGEGFVLTTVPSVHGVGGPASSPPAGAAPAEDVEPSTVRAARLALVIGNMHRPRLLGVPGEDLPHVSHYLDDPHVYFDRRVLIVGGKNSAVEAALRLYRVGAKVAISYRGTEFSKRVKYWLRPELEWLIKKEKVGYFPATVPGRITRRAVELRRAETGDAADRVPADVVLLLTGYEQSPDLFERAGVNLVGEDRAPEHDEDTMETNVPGVFVAGTAASGSQRRTRLFIENSHAHVGKIVRAIAGVEIPWIREADYESLAES